MISALLLSYPALGKALKALPWVLAVAGLVGTLWFREKATACESSKLAEAIEAARQVAAAKADDAKLTRSLEEQLRPVMAAIQEQRHATATALARVQSDPNCASTAAARAFDGGMRASGQQAGSGPARPARP